MLTMFGISLISVLRYLTKATLREEKICFCLILDHYGAENTESFIAVAVSGEGACSH